MDVFLHALASIALCTAKRSLRMAQRIDGGALHEAVRPTRHPGVHALYYRTVRLPRVAPVTQRAAPTPWFGLVPALTLVPSPDSFRRVFGQRDFGRYFVNSLVVACSAVIVSALIAFLAATAVTRFRFRFRTLTVPLFLRLRDFALLNTRGSLILPRIAFSPPFAIWMPRGFGKAVPEALEEAAYIDGASRA